MTKLRVMAGDSEINVESAKELGEKLGISWESSPFTPDALAKGFTVELEHGSRDPETNVTDDDPTMTAKIAWAHLKEDSNYYEKLEKMEQKKPEEEKPSISKEAVSVRELQTEAVPKLEHYFMQLRQALDSEDAQKILDQAFYEFYLIKDKLNSLGDVDPIVFGPSSKQ